MNKQIAKHIIRYILMICIIIVCVIIFKFSAQGGDASTGTSSKVSKAIVTLANGNKKLSEEQINQKIEIVQPVVRKLAHFTIYNILGILLMCCALTFKNVQSKKICISLLLSFIYACTDEFHQLFVPGRCGNFIDIGIDTSGALLGILFVTLISILIKKIKKNRANELLDKNDKIAKKRNIIFIASTGGHLNELMQVKPLFNKFEYHIITEKTKVDDSLKEEYGDKIKFLIYGTKKYKFKYIFKFIANCFISLYYYFKYQPEVIVTTGTHTAVPMCYIGKIFGSKVIFIETFANRTTGTVAGRLVYPIADTFVVQWEEMQKVYPKSVCWGWIY